jgi:Chaperone of endosialidase
MSIGGLAGSAVSQGVLQSGINQGQGTLAQGVSQAGLGTSIANGQGLNNTLTSGLTGGSNLQATNPFNTNTIGGSFAASPGYQFSLNQALQAGQNSAASQGNLLSGASQMGLQNTAAQAANQNYYQYVGSQQSGLGSYLNSLLGGSQQGVSAGLGTLSAFGGLANSTVSGSAGAANGIGTQAASGIDGLIGGIGRILQSDRRVKTDLVRLGTFRRLPIYAFRYVTDRLRAWHVGVMAQDVEKMFPDAVATIAGIKHVDYGALING